MHIPILQIPDVTKEVINPTDTIRKATENFIKDIASDPEVVLNRITQELIEFGFKLLAAIAVYIIGLWLIKRIKKALSALLTKRKTEKTIASFISSLVSILLTITLVIFTISTLGINTTSIAALLGAGAMAIGMALSSSMENFAGGLIILFFKPFKAGDFITVNGYSGTVKEVTIVNTKIITPDNRVVIIPNGSISNGTIDNFSNLPYRRIDIPVTVEYGSDPQKCIDALQEIALANDYVLSGDEVVAPAAEPYAFLNSMNDSNVEFVIRVWVKNESYWDAKFTLNKSIYAELPKYGFDFAFPHMDVTMKKES